MNPRDPRTDRKLADTLIAQGVTDVVANDGVQKGKIPSDMVTASASGLDPHLSPEAALWQAPRIAAARGLAVERIESLVREHVEGRAFGFLGEPRVNVLALNLALDEGTVPSQGV
jgi:K+-transporting ATPase ATPase C chain